ncbi:MAG: hypothetical protein GYA29_06320 [Methanothrix sp.]|nr:hypothetical protein [Methanothrix sp.]
MDETTQFGLALKAKEFDKLILRGCRRNFQGPERCCLLGSIRNSTREKLKGQEIHALKGVVCLKFSALECSSGAGRGIKPMANESIRPSTPWCGTPMRRTLRQSSALCSPMARF